MIQPDPDRPRRRLRRVILMVALAAAFFWLGANYPSPPQPQLCKVYG